jgi:hypothetical protein
MNEWMEHIYHQAPTPSNVKGVTVSVDTLDPNNNMVHIGNTTTDANGMYSLMFKPDITGMYTIMVSFGGSGSYYPSSGQAALSVVEATATQQPSTGTTQAEPLALYLAIATAVIVIAIALVGLALWRRH